MNNLRYSRFGTGSSRLGSVAALLALVLLVAAQGCGGDGNGGTTIVEYCGEFDPSQAPAPGRVAMRLGDDDSCGIVVIEIVATDLDDVAGLAADLTYDPTFAFLTDVSTSGSVLTSDGAQVAAHVEESILGQVTVGIARTGVPGIDIQGTQLVATLLFVVDTLASNSGQITLTDQCLTGGGTPPDPLPGLVCSGGTIRVR